MCLKTHKLILIQHKVLKWYFYNNIFIIKSKKFHSIAMHILLSIIIFIYLFLIVIVFKF